MRAGPTGRPVRTTGGARIDSSAPGSRNTGSGATRRPASAAANPSARPRSAARAAAPSPISRCPATSVDVNPSPAARAANARVHAAPRGDAATVPRPAARNASATRRSPSSSVRAVRTLHPNAGASRVASAWSDSARAEPRTLPSPISDSAPPHTSTARRIIASRSAGPMRSVRPARSTRTALRARNDSSASGKHATRTRPSPARTWCMTRPDSRNRASVRAETPSETAASFASMAPPRNAASGGSRRLNRRMNAVRSWSRSWPCTTDPTSTSSGRYRVTRSTTSSSGYSAPASTSRTKSSASASMRARARASAKRVPSQRRAMQAVRNFAAMGTVRSSSRGARRRNHHGKSAGAAGAGARPWAWHSCR